MFILGVLVILAISEFACCQKDVKIKKDSLLPGDISNQKCNEYLEYRSKEDNFKREKEVKFREDAEELQFPHMAILGFVDQDHPEGNNISWVCGASIISDQYVLTVAHCIMNIVTGPPKFVMYGTTDISDIKNRIVAKVKSVTVHPRYIRASFLNDIGLIQLENKIKFNEKVHPVCLNTDAKLNISKATLAGFGSGDPIDPRNLKLKFVDQNVFSKGECIDAYKDTRRLSGGFQEDTMICAGAVDGLHDACRGDSGGPLQILKEGVAEGHMYELFGIASFGKSCGAGVPAIYTRVSSYVKWIENLAWS